MKKLQPKSDNQSKYLEAIEKNKIIFVNGPAGTGKTFIPSVWGLEALQSKKYDKLVISRPMVQSDNDSGFLPGELENKLEPYMRPILDVFGRSLTEGDIETMIKKKSLELAPLGYMLGRSFYKSFIILDEMQNATFEQVVLALTRFATGSKMILTGDSRQSFLPGHKQGGFQSMMQKLEGIEGIGVIHLEHQDIVREPIIKAILERLNETQGTDGKKGINT